MALKVWLGASLLAATLLAGGAWLHSPAGGQGARTPGVPANSQPAQPAAVASANVRQVRPTTWKLGSLTLTSCELAQPQTGLSTAAWCAKFPVPENRTDANSRKIALNLAVLRSSAQVANPDMLVFLAGGPGQAATASARTIGAVLRPLLAHHHVLLLDQRGTGGSNPLACAQDDAELAPDSGVGLNAAKVRMAAMDCLRQVSSHADPRYYTTTIAAQDLDDVRRALGSPQFDLVGVSYGTRMAQQYLHDFPEAVRSVVLDSVVPNSLVLGESFARNLQDALHAQFARCTAEPACAKQFGNPQQTLTQLRDALRANPHQVSYRDPQTYQTVQQMLDEDVLASVVRMFSYTPATAALLPLSIDAAAHGDVGPLLGQAKILSVDLTELAGSGMQYSVVCSEDADLYQPRPQDADTLLGTRVVDALKAICAVWPKGTRPANFHAPLVSDKPVLLLAGQYDPVTPPRYAQEVAKHLSDARVLVLKGQAHSVMAAGCMPDLIRQFIQKLDPRDLDASCLERLQPVPIFLNFNGATP
ncbi:MAG: alpha/beta hydrolase [Rhodanobacter sp.]